VATPRGPRVLVLARNYPNDAFPTLGLWTERLVVASTAVARPTVLAPVPYAPPLLPNAYFRRFRTIAKARFAGGIDVRHPRVPAGPGQLLHAFDARLGLPVLRREALKLHREEPFDLIHAHFIYPDGVIAAGIGKALGVPVISSEHAMWRPWLDNHPAVRRQVEHALPSIARITTVSDALRQGIVELFGDAVPVDILPNVVDDEVFDLPRSGEHRDPNQILFVGLIRHVKGLDVLIRALGPLFERRPQLRLAVAGGAFFRGYERDAAEVRSLVTTLGLSDRVQFLGDVPPAEVARLMRTSALLVVPSRRESFSLVTAEAIASGTPVVATRCGGPEEIVTPQTGALVPTDDPVGLAAGIDEVLERRFDPVALRLDAVSRFGTDAAVERLGQLYARVTGIEASPLRPQAPRTSVRAPDGPGLSTVTSGTPTAVVQS
jgi:glycosyltransferase involved in cell wall biosynthesis